MHNFYFLNLLIGFTFISSVMLTNVNCVVSSIGKVKYELHTRCRDCRAYSDLIENITCPAKRINRNAEYSAVDLFIKPGVQLDNLFVWKYCVPVPIIILLI